MDIENVPSYEITMSEDELDLIFELMGSTTSKFRSEAGIKESLFQRMYNTLETLFDN